MKKRYMILHSQRMKKNNNILSEFQDSTSKNSNILSEFKNSRRKHRKREYSSRMLLFFKNVIHFCLYSFRIFITILKCIRLLVCKNMYEFVFKFECIRIY